jgi:tetratricopeptide (TPR) repeat protein
MVRIIKIALLALVLFLFTIPTSAQNTNKKYYPSIKSSDKLPLNINKLSNRLLLIKTKTGNSNVAVLSSQKGLIMLDAGFSPDFTLGIKSIAQQKFGRDDWYGLIHTNPEMLNAGGNSAFAGTKIIAHNAVSQYLLEMTDNLPSYLKQRAEEFHQRVTRSENQLKDMGPNSEQATGLKEWIRLCKYVARDWDEGFKLSYSSITFEKKLNIDLGDMTLHLFYFGRTPGNGQVLAWVPDEQFLWLGDIFHAAHILPYGSNYGPEGADLDRWLNVLDTILDDARPLKHIYRTNGNDIWSRETLTSRRDFIRDLYNKVKNAESRRLDLQATQEWLCNFKDTFPYILEWDTFFHEGIIRGDISNVIIGHWKKSHLSAAEALYTTLEKDGAESAQKLSHKIKQQPESYYLIETELNSMGYRFLNQDKMNKAVEMFQMAIQFFPESANLYDNLGETYMKNGQKNLAIKNYKKSLELNPDNDNAKKMLNQLKK